MVEVSVIALEKSGKFSSGLTREDFTITENGQPQRIADFAAFVPHSTAAPTPGVYTNQNLSGALTVILLDSANVPFGDQSSSRAQLIRWLKEAPLQDRIALVALDTSMHLLHDFTSDRDALIDTLNHYTPKSDPRLQALPPEPRGNPAASGGPDPYAIMARQWSDYTNPVRLRNTISAIEQIARVLSRFKERKNIIWISGDFPIYIPGASIGDPYKAFAQESRKAIELLSNAGIAVYPVNPAGVSQLGTAADVRMDTLASDTGGKAFYLSNDLRGVFQSVLTESRSTYTLAYYPTNTHWDDQFRTIKVTVRRPGVQLHYRNGYLASSAPPPASENVPLLKAPLDEVVASGLEFTGIGLDAKLEPAAGQQKVTVTLNGNDLALAPKGAEHTGAVDFLIAVGNTQANNFTGLPDRLNLQLQDDVYRKILAEGLVLTKSIPVPAGADQMRIVVRDANSGIAGSLVMSIRK